MSKVINIPNYPQLTNVSSFKTLVENSTIYNLQNFELNEFIMADLSLNNQA